MTKNDEKPDYHGVAPISHIIKKMKKEYDRDPKGWKVIGATDQQGNADMFIMKKPNAYWLKSKMLSPYSSLSMGSIVRNIDKEINEQVYKGRDLSPDELFRLFGMIVPVKRDQNIVATGIEKFSQEKGNYLKKVIEDMDPNLGKILMKRIDEEFTKKYPQRKNLYI